MYFPKLTTFLIYIFLLISFSPKIAETKKMEPEKEKEEEANDWFYFRSEYSELLKQKKTFEKEVQTLKTEKTKLEAENKELKEKIANLESELNSTKEAHLAYKKEVESKILTLETTIKSLTDRQVSLESTIALLRKEYESAKEKDVKERATINETILKIETEKNTIQEKNKLLTKEIEELSKEKKELLAQIESSSSQLKEAEAKLAQAERDAELEASKKKDIPSTVEPNTPKENSSSVLEDTIAILREENKKLVKELEDLQESVIKLNKELSTSKENGIKLSQENEKLKREMEFIMADQKKDLEDVLISEIKNGDIQVTQNGKKIIINMNEMITFDSGSARLKKSGKSALDKILKTLNKYKNQKILIEGNTDNLPISNSKFPDNWHLSVARSIAVMKYLIKKGNVYPKNLSVVGNGPYNPIKENTSPENRAANRRVDIVVSPLELVQ
jgi:chemotaxis protein MotB